MVSGWEPLQSQLVDFKVQHMDKLAGWIDSSLKDHKDDKKLESIRLEVKEFTKDFPLPSDK